MNNTNGTQVCPGPGGERWWVWLVTSGIIYIFGLSLSSLAYTIYYVIKKSHQKNKTSEKSETAGESVSATAGMARQKRHSLLSPLRWREMARQLISGDTIPSKVLITFILLCNTTYIILAIIRTYSPIEMCFVLSESPALIVELVVVVFLILFTLLRFCAADTPIHYWLNLRTIVDAFTLPHIFVSIVLGQDWLGLRTLRFIWLTQIVEFTRFIPYIPQDAVDLFSVLFNFLILWLTGAGIIHLLEVQGDPWNNFDNAVQGLSFLDFCYYVMITLSTVGYGDISPSTNWGRAFITFFIIGGLAFFAAILPALAEVTTTVHRKLQYAKFDTTRVPRHVIVCGHINSTSASEFLNDFLHPDRGDKYTHILFLHPERPDQDLKTVLRSFYTRVQFIVGSVLNGKDLLRAKILKSSACFIIANKHCENPIEEDNANLLRLVSIKNTTTEVPVILQLLHSSSKQQVYNIEGWRNGRDIAITLNELKLGLLGQSCVSPGFSTLIANLFYTSDFPVLKHFDPNNWQTPYIKGASNEIYTSSFSDTFRDQTYHEAARICYTNLGLILLALEDSDKLYINPSPDSHQNLVIRSGIDGMCGYFIGQDQKHVQLVSTYCEKCHGNDPADDLEVLTKRLRGRSCSCSKGKYITKDVELANLELSNGTLDSSSANIPMEGSTPKERKKLQSKGSVYLHSAQSIDDSIFNPETNVTDRASHSKLDMKNHVVLCVFANENSAPLGLHNFLRPLRSNSIPVASTKPVVIISNETYLEREWPWICRFPDVHLVLGSPLHLANLEQANVGECGMCVILTALSASARHEQAINDKEAVLCSLSIQKRYHKHVQILTDLNFEANVQFLDFGDEDQPDERIYKAQPFACGEAFSVSMFDSVTSSAFHSPGTVYIIEKMIHTSGSSSMSPGSCQVVALPLRDTEHANKTFGKLYNAQLDKKAICLAIYRQLPHDPSKHYVITAPDSRMKLDETDIAFVMVGEQNELVWL